MTEWECSLWPCCDLLIQKHNEKHLSWHCGLCSKAISKHKLTGSTDGSIRVMVHTEWFVESDWCTYTKWLHIACTMRLNTHTTVFGSANPLQMPMFWLQKICKELKFPPLISFCSMSSQPSFSPNVFLFFFFSFSCFPDILKHECDCTVWMDKAMLSVYWEYHVS